MVIKLQIRGGGKMRILSKKLPHVHDMQSQIVSGQAKQKMELVIIENLLLPVNLSIILNDNYNWKYRS